MSLFSQVYSCRYRLIGRLTVNRHVISFFHSPVLRYAVVAFHSVNICDLIFFQCFLSVYTQYLWPISPIRPISPIQCFYGPLQTAMGSLSALRLNADYRLTQSFNTTVAVANNERERYIYFCNICNAVACFDFE